MPWFGGFISGVRSFAVTFALSIGCWIPTPALAQGAAAAAPPSAPVTPPDLVLKRDGSMLRGTIIEKVAGQYVSIQLVDGQTRRVPMSEVRYAGIANQAPTDAGAETPPDEADASDEEEESYAFTPSSAVRLT
jgi:hypothetical protein